MSVTRSAVQLPRRVLSVSSRHVTQRGFSCSAPRDTAYGFIGLGQMGYRMAKNLRDKLPSSDELIIQDVNTDATSRFKSEATGAHVHIAKTVREVAETSDTIITVLPEPKHVKAVYNDMLSSSALRARESSTGRLFIDCSTIDPMTSADVATLVSEGSNASFVDAPMSGGVVGAEAATLTFMIGAEEEAITRVTSVLGLMGQRILHMGLQGSGLKAKLANNYLLALNNIATCEAMNMGIRWGLDPKALAGMINISTGRCWPSEVNNPVPGVLEKAPASRDYNGGFGVSLMTKDLKLALKAAQEYDLPVRLGETARTMYEAVESDPKLKPKDFSVVYRYIGGRE